MLWPSTMTTTITSCPLTHRNYVHHYVITELYTVHYKYKPTEPCGLSHLHSWTAEREKKFQIIFKNRWTILTTNEPNLQQDHSPYHHVTPIYLYHFFVIFTLPLFCQQHAHASCLHSPLYWLSNFNSQPQKPLLMKTKRLKRTEGYTR